MFFGAGRAAFLEFLRNLSPQIMLLAIALVLSSRLDLSRFLWTAQGIKNAFPFVATLAIFLGAMMANITLFLEKSTTSSRSMRRVENLARRKYKGKPWSLLRALLWAGFRYNRAGLFQGLTAAAVAEIGLTVMFIAAIPAAASAIQTLYSK